MSNKPKPRRLSKVERIMNEKSTAVRRGMRSLFKPSYERRPL